MTRRKIALTGGIACGKSLLSLYLKELGFEILDADDIAHSLVPPDERARLAKTVFRDPAARRELEARLHPAIRRRIADWFAEEAEDPETPADPETPENPVPGAVRRIAAIPLLFEVHGEKDFDTILCVVSSREKQRERMTAKRGYSREEAEARLSAQMDAEEKASRSHYAIRNDGTPDELKAEAEKLARWLAR